MRILVAIACLLAACGSDDPQLRLEDRLLAPCCWRESLHEHDSDIAARLRAEIATRLAAGEAPQAIEDSIVVRYGERIRTVPRGSDPRWAIGAGVSALAVFALSLVVLRVRRRRPEPARRPVLDPDPDLADWLDDELCEVD